MKKVSEVTLFDPPTTPEMCPPFSPAQQRRQQRNCRCQQARQDLEGVNLRHGGCRTPLGARTLLGAPVLHPVLLQTKGTIESYPLTFIQVDMK